MPRFTALTKQNGCCRMQSGDQVTIEVADTETRLHMQRARALSGPTGLGPSLYMFDLSYLIEINDPKNRLVEISCLACEVERPLMWIALFSIAIAVTIGLTVAAILMQGRPVQSTAWPSKSGRKAN